MVCIYTSRDTNSNRLGSISGYSTAVTGDWAFRCRLNIQYKVSDGTETGFTVTLNTGDAYIGATTYVFTGFSAAALDAGVEAFVSDSSPDQTESVAGGTATAENEEVIVIGQCHHGAQIDPYDTAPSGYATRYDLDGGPTAMPSGYKITGSTETPSYSASWGTSFSSTFHVFALCAFKGAGGGGGVTQVRQGVDLLSGGIGGHASQMLGGLLAA